MAKPSASSARERDVDLRLRAAPSESGDRRCGDRSQALEPAADDLDQRLVRGGTGSNSARRSAATHTRRPVATAIRATRPCAASSSIKRGHAALRAAFLLGQEGQPQQRIVQFVGRRRIRPRLGAHPRDRLRVELADVGGGSRDRASGGSSRPGCAAPRAAHRRDRHRGAHSAPRAPAAKAR